jgi:hypothetical protein
MTTNPSDVVAAEGQLQRQISWKFDDAEVPLAARRWHRAALHAVLSLAAGFAMMLAPLVLDSFKTSTNTTSVTGASQVSAVDRTAQDLTAERDREPVQILTHQLTTAREEIEALKARVTDVVKERIQAEQALETAQRSAVEQNGILEKERQRTEALLRELTIAHQELQALKAPANDATSLTKQPASPEQERQQNYGELGAAPSELQSLTARTAALTSDAPTLASTSSPALSIAPRTPRIAKQRLNNHSNGGASGCSKAYRACSTRTSTPRIHGADGFFGSFGAGLQ